MSPVLNRGYHTQREAYRNKKANSNLIGSTSPLKKKKNSSSISRHVLTSRHVNHASIISIRNI